MNTSVIELRQYDLHAGRRDDLIALFEREFIETQETVGIRVLGQFRDLDRPDRFTWLRGFPDMPSRAKSLSAFYDGPTWKKFRDEANATMIDSDNVLLLRPAWAESNFAPAARPTKGELAAQLRGVVCPIAAPAADEVIAIFRREAVPALGAAGVNLRAALITEPGPNNFPRLPVREGETVLVWFESGKESSPLPKSLARYLTGDPEVLRLAPTARSALR